MPRLLIFVALVLIEAVLLRYAFRDPSTLKNDDSHFGDPPPPV